MAALACARSAYIQLQPVSKGFNRVTKKSKKIKNGKISKGNIQSSNLPLQGWFLSSDARSFQREDIQKNNENGNSMEFHTSQKVEDSVATAPISKQILANHPCTRRKRRSLLQSLQHIQHMQHIQHQNSVRKDSKKNSVRKVSPCQLGGWGWSYPFSSGPGIFLYKMPDLSLQNGLPGNSLY